MFSKFYIKSNEVDYADNLFEEAKEKYHYDKAASLNALQKLRNHPVRQSSILPKLKGLIFHLEQYKDKLNDQEKDSCLTEFNKLIENEKIRAWIKENDYFELLKSFLPILHREQGRVPAYKQMLCGHFFELLKKQDGIALVNELKLENFQIITVDIHASILAKYSNLQPEFLMVITSVLYDAIAMSEWIAYARDFFKKNNVGAAEILLFMDLFNLDQFAIGVLENVNLENFVELLYKMVVQGKFSPNILIDLVDRFFNSSKDSLQTYFSDLFNYYQAKCYLCGIDTEKAVQKLESVSPDNSNLYKEVCYELGAYYCKAYWQAKESAKSDVKIDCYRDKATNYLQQALAHGHSNKEEINGLLGQLHEEAPENQGGCSMSAFKSTI